MFHHFHGGRHVASQGSISADEFARVLDFVAADEQLVGADEFHERAVSGTLGNDRVCITFDDSLLCQYEVAWPVMEERGLTGFFFVHSGAFVGPPDLLEVYRHFRTTQFAGIDDFYDRFFERARASHPGVGAAIAGFDPSTYLVEYAFYSDRDRLFRHLRDDVLGADRYDAVMAALMEERAYSPESVRDLLYMRERHLTELRAAGNHIGLHSHTHPLSMGTLAPERQRDEYLDNMRFIESVLGERPRSMSHPMGRYSDHSLAALVDMGVQVGFRDNPSIAGGGTLLELPREDHTSVMARMARCA